MRMYVLSCVLHKLSMSAASDLLIRHSEMRTLRMKHFAALVCVHFDP